MKISSKIILFLLIAPTASYAATNPLEDFKTKCVKDFSELSADEVSFCSKFMSTAYKAEVIELNKSILETLIREQGEGSLKIFRESNEAWEILKDKTCEIKALMFEKPNPIKDLCEVDFYETRVKDLKELNDFINPE